MAFYDDLRSTFGKDLSDEELLVTASDALKMPMGKLAQEAGIDSGGKWGNRASGSIDAAQSQLLGAGADAAEALGLPGVSKWANERQQKNASEAKAQQRIAQEQGAISDWRDVSGLRSGAEYVGGLLLDSAPQMAAGIAGGAIGGLAGTAVAGPAGGVAGAMAGGALAGAPFNYGDIREGMQEHGEVNKAAALGLTIPYSMLDMIGGEGQILKGIGKRAAKGALKEEGEAAAKQVAKQAAEDAPTSLNLLDRQTGLTGVAARTAYNAGKTGLEEGFGETGQEVVKRYGEKVVDPNVDMTDAESLQRYGDSFIGGAAMGTAIGGLHGGWKRTEAGQKFLDEQAKGKATLGDDATAFTGEKGEGLMGPPTPEIHGPMLPTPEGPQPEITGPQPPVIERPPTQIEGPVAPGARQAVGDVFGAVAGQPGAPAAPTEEERRQKAIDTVADQVAQERKDRAQRGTDRGVQQGNLGLYHTLETLHKNNQITDDEFATNLGLLKVENDKDAVKEVKGFLDDTATKQKEAAAKAKLAEAGIKEPTGTEKAPAGTATATTTTAAPSNKATAATTAAAAPAPAAPAKAATTKAPAAPKAVKEPPAVGPPRELVGPRKDRTTAPPEPHGPPRELVGPPRPSRIIKARPAEKVPPMEPVAVKPKAKPKRVLARDAVDAYVARVVPNTPLTEEARQRIYLAAGLDMEGNVISQPLTYKQAAKAEATRTGKEVQDTAIQKDLIKYGFTKKALVQLNKSSSATVDTEGKTAAVTEEGDVAPDTEFEGKGAVVAAPDEEDDALVAGGSDVVEQGAEAERKEEGQAADEAELDEEGNPVKPENEDAQYGSGMSTISTFNESKARNKETVLQRFRRSLKELSESAELDDEQRAAFERLSTRHEEVPRAKKYDKKEKEQQRDAIAADVDELLNGPDSEYLFPTGVPEWLPPLFEHGKTTAAEIRNEAAVNIVKQSDAGPSEEVTEHNKLIEALMDPERAAAIRATLSPEMQKMMDHFLREQHGLVEKEDEGVTLDQLVPEDEQDSVVLARSEWNGNLDEGEAAWDELTPVEQASWVHTVYERMDVSPPRLTNQEYFRAMMELAEEVRGRIEKENADGQGTQGRAAETVTSESESAAEEVSADGQAGARDAVGREEPATEAVSAGTDEARTGGAAEGSGNVARTDTPAFKRWFGSSKIVYPALTEDERKQVQRGPVSAAAVAAKYGVSLEGVENPEALLDSLAGKPRVMYHGTARDFVNFVGKQAKSIFLTYTPKFADKFANMSAKWIAEHPEEVAAGTGAGPNVMPLYVKAENPFDYENPRHVTSVTTWIHAHGDRNSITGDRMEWLQNGSWTIIEGPSFQEAIKARGFDSYFVVEDGVRNLAVYDSSQVKSVTGNAGTYDPGSGSILENRERTAQARAETEAPLTVEPPEGTQTPAGQPRSPSVVRELRKLEKQLTAGEITPEAFANRASALLATKDWHDVTKPVPSRVRDVDHIRAELLEARRSGALDPDGVEFADWLLRRNPQFARGLGISIRAARKNEAGVSGYYVSASRIITLLKGSENAETAVHEILHHMERMMPAAMQNAIRRAWMLSTARTRQAAFKGSNTDVQAYYRALLQYHFGDNNPAQLEIARKLLADGKVGYEHYQHFNPSEFWAINGTSMLQGRFMNSDSMVGRIKQWVKEFVQKAKALLHLPSDAPVIRALDALARGDGSFQTGVQIADQEGVHFMYGGQKSANQEKVAQYQRARWMQDSGQDMEYIRRQTGWFRSGYDGKWRYEFNDQNAAWKQDPKTLVESPLLGKQTYYKMGDVLDHPELYAAYPDARDIQFVVRPGLFDLGGLQGWFGKNGIGVTPYAEDHLATVLHEIQHWIQKKEGFAAGGNAESVFRAMSPKQRSLMVEALSTKEIARIEKLEGEIAATRKLMDSTQVHNIIALHKGYKARDAEAKLLPEGSPERKAMEARSHATWTALEKFQNQYAQENFGVKYHHSMEMADYSAMMAVARDGDLVKTEARLAKMTKEIAEKKAKIEELSKATPEALAKLASSSPEAHKAYERLAGEIEARDVSHRQVMSDEERKNTAPYSFEGISPKEAIVTFTAPDEAAMYNVERSPAERSAAFTETVKKTTAGLPPKQAAWARHTALSTKGAIGTLVRSLSFTEDIARRAAAAIPSVKPYMAAMQRSMMAARMRIQKLATMRDQFMAVDKGERLKVNAFLKASTMSGEWGYQPKHVSAKDSKFKADSATAKAFNALTPEGQQIVRDVFTHGYDSLMAMKKAVNDSVAARYDESIAQLREAGDLPAAAAAERKKADALKEFARLRSMDETTPYAPLKRFGDFVVVGKSQAYLEAEGRKDKAEMNKLQRQPQHYYVAMRETRGEAAMHADEISSQYSSYEHFKKDNAYSSFGTASMMAGFSRMSTMLARTNVTASAKSEAALHRLMTDLYYSLLAEGSARQAERMRLKVAGADEDMMRSFITKGRADAHFISMIESNGAAQKALVSMREEASATGVVKGTTREQRQDDFNEILKRHAMSLDWRPTPKTDWVLQATSYMQLLTSPASWFINATQPMAVSAPVMAGRHGMMNSMAAMTKAYRDVMVPLAKAAKEGRIDDAKLLALVPEAERPHIEALLKSGHISSDSNYDLKDWESTQDPRVWNKINSRIKDVMGDVELLNRVVTAVAAVRLEKAKNNAEGATAYAAKMIYDTHGDYSGFNAPAVMRTPTGRLLGQYRKFQLIQMGMYGRLFKDAFANSDPKERWVAQKALAYSFGTMGVLAGGLGVPGAQIIGYMLAAAFGDDNEPVDPEMTMRKIIGNEDMANLLLKGVPAFLGVDMSGRIGAGSLGNPLPFGKLGLDRKSMTTNVVAAAGPAVGTAINFLDGLSKIGQGNAVGGLQQMLPKGAANAIKGFDIMTRGIRQPNGDVAIGPEEMTAFDGAMQALGMPTTKVTSKQARASAKYELDTFYKDHTTALKKEYTEAHKDGDAQAAAEVREKWADMQAHKKANGYKPAPLSDLLKAPSEQAKREKATIGGVQYRGKDAGVVRQLEELY